MPPSICSAALSKWVMPFSTCIRPSSTPCQVCPRQTTDGVQANRCSVNSMRRRVILGILPRTRQSCVSLHLQKSFPCAAQASAFYNCLVATPRRCDNSSGTRQAVNPSKDAGFSLSFTAVWQKTYLRMTSKIYKSSHLITAQLGSIHILCAFAYANVYLKTTIIKQNMKIILFQNNIYRSEVHCGIAGVPFDSVRRFRASLLLEPYEVGESKG